HRHKMPLKERVYICPECGHTEDRDLNASKNIERWFEGILIPVRSLVNSSNGKLYRDCLWSGQTLQSSD
ncbi:MAG: zinc ribbon domain-containing protein, partial [Cyanobacteria bacterium J06573_2]